MQIIVYSSKFKDESKEDDKLFTKRYNKIRHFLGCCGISCTATVESTVFYGRFVIKGYDDDNLQYYYLDILRVIIPELKWGYDYECL